VATKHTQVSGSYDQTPEDSGKGQSKAKFTKSYPKPTDSMSKPSHKGSKPQAGKSGYSPRP